MRFLGAGGKIDFSSCQFPGFGQDGNVLRFYSYTESFTSEVELSETFEDIYTGSTGVNGVAMKGIIEAGNGYVYIFPASGGQIRKFDPSTEGPMESPVGLSAMLATNQGVSIHLDDSGRYIYVFSVRENQGRGAVKIDTETDTLTSISTSGSESRLYGVKAPNGNIYFTPYFRNTANSFTKFNMETETFSTFGPVLSPNLFGWHNTSSVVVGLDEKIYCVMRDKVIEIDPMTDSITWDSGFGLGLSAQFSNIYTGGCAVLAPNGCLYSPPREANGITSSILKLDLTQEAGLTYTTIPYPYATARYYRTRGVIGADGNLYYTSRYAGSATNCMKIDWRTDTITEFGSGLVNACCDHLSDMIISSNGSIYCTINSSYSTRAIKKITSSVSRSLPKGFFLSRYIKNSSNGNTE